MLRAILNRSWQQHPTQRQLYGHLRPITKTIQARQTRHAGHCWRSQDEIVSDVLLWTPAYGQSKAGRPARTFIQQPCDDTGCNPEDLPKPVRHDDDMICKRIVYRLCYFKTSFLQNSETLMRSLERLAAGIGLHVNAHKTEYMCLNQRGDISALNGSSLKLVDKFTYLGSSVSSTETDIDIRLTKTWTAVNRLSVIRKSDLTDRMKPSFFQAAIVSILQYECTTWMLTKRMEKKFDDNDTRMLRAILNKSWRQHLTK